MKEQPRTQLENQAIQAYLELGDAIRLAALPAWITADLTISQLKAVFLLAHHAALAVGELAGLLGLGNPAASILVQGLVEQGFVERSEDTQDRRRTLVKLTARGAKLISGPREHGETRLRHWLSHLSDEELAGLLRGLRALVEIAHIQQEQTSQPADRVPDRME